VILFLSNSKVNPSAENNYGNNSTNLIILFIAIRIASKKDHFEIVKLLFNDSRVDPSAIHNWGNNFIDLK
jgi:hypothetical protein